MNTASLLPAAGEMLATGWEPDAPAHDTLVRNYLATLVDRLAMLARNGAGRSEIDDDVFLVDLDSAYVFDNTVVVRRPLGDEAIRRVIERAGRFFPTDRSWTLFSSTPVGDLRGAGLELVGHPPLMYRPAGGRASTPPPGLEIRRVRTGTDLADFERTIVTAYPLPEGSAVVAPGVLETGFRAWVGYVDGSPVATAGSHTAHGLTEVEWVSTLAGQRGRGIGSAMAWQATNADPDVDAVLVATDEGRPVYASLGYVAVTRFTMWLRRA